VTALNALGIHDVTVMTHRDPVAVSSPPPSATMLRFGEGDSGLYVATDAGDVPMAKLLAQHDVVVNCVLQDPDNPYVFVSYDDLPGFRQGSLVVDVSCDAGMGFEWARPTSFEDPMFEVGDGLHYYAVDHSPSYLWDAATWEISEALLPYLETVLAGPEGWDADVTIQRAIEIRDGVVQNPKILSFQGRAEEYPHDKLGE
jgi:alanine dehydrogenase